MNNAPDPGDFTVTVQIQSPEMRRTLAAIASALEDAESACGPSRAGLSGRASGKPGSRPPSGNLAAVALCRRIGHDVERIVRRVEAFYADLDPEHAERTKEHRAMVKRKRAEIREQQRADLIHRVTVRDGRLVAVAHQRLADAINEEGRDEV